MQDATNIDAGIIALDGPSARIFDLPSLAKLAPDGDLSAAKPFIVKARDVGQVSAVTLDDGLGADGTSGPPNVYLGATSLYGLKIIAAPAGSNPIQKPLSIGEPAAQWMPGQFGTANGGGAGSIWKVDGKTGEVTLFANVGIGGHSNSGPGVGGLAFDPVRRQIYASDLETGMIHRFDLKGTSLGYFDHGVDGRLEAGLKPLAFDARRRASIQSPAFDVLNHATWGYAPRERMVWDLLVDSNRLYYAVADGPKIWSVGINPDGSLGGDARAESKFDTLIGTSKAELISGLTEEVIAGRPPREGFCDEERRFGTTSPKVRSALKDSLADNVLDALQSADRITETSRAFVPASGGQLGATRIWKRCGGAPGSAGIANKESTPAAPGGVTFGQPVPPPVAASDARPRLILSQRCAACTVGGLCACRIDVDNRGSAPPSAPIVLDDIAHILSGPDAGSAAGLARVKPDAPGWSCKPGEGQSYSCSIPGNGFWPGSGRHLDLEIATAAMAEHGSFGVRNCAKLARSADVSEQTACRDLGGEVMIQQTVEGACLPGQSCRLSIVLTNVGETGFAGEVNISDTITLVGRGLLGAGITISPPLGCAIEPKTMPFSCNAQLELRPGEQRRHTIEMRLEVNSGERGMAAACATATDPSVEPDRLLPGLPPQRLEGPGYSCAIFGRGLEIAGNGTGMNAPGSPGAGVAQNSGPQSGDSSGAGGAGSEDLRGYPDPNGEHQDGQGRPGGSNGAADNKGAAKNPSGTAGTGGDANKGAKSENPGGAGLGDGRGSTPQPGASQPGASQSGGSQAGAPPSQSPQPKSPQSQPSQQSQSGGENGSGSGSGFGPGPGGGLTPVVDIPCPPGMIRDGTQCYCAPRGYAYVGGRCVPPPAASPTTVADASGAPSAGRGVGGDAEPGWAKQCGTGSNVAACCAAGTAWNGLRCAPSVSDDLPNYGGAGQPPCEQPGLVRDSSGKCDCPPYLERHADAQANTICCLVPCAAGEKRVNATCVPDCAAQGLVLTGDKCTCPPGQEKYGASCITPHEMGVGGTKQPETPPSCPSTMELHDGECSCPSGKQWNGTACQPQTKQVTLPDTAPEEIVPNSCPPTMQLAGTQCVCPAGQLWNGAACAGRGSADTPAERPSGGPSMSYPSPQRPKSAPHDDEPAKPRRTVDEDEEPARRPCRPGYRRIDGDCVRLRRADDNPGPQNERPVRPVTIDKVCPDGSHVPIWVKCPRRYAEPPRPPPVVIQRTPVNPVPPPTKTFRFPRPAQPQPQPAQPRPAAPAPAPSNNDNTIFYGGSGNGAPKKFIQPN